MKRLYTLSNKDGKKKKMFKVDPKCDELLRKGKLNLLFTIKKNYLKNKINLYSERMV